MAANEIQRREPKTLARLLAWLRGLAGLEWLAVAAAAPLLLFPTARPHWTAAALAVLAVLWLLRWAVHGEPWPVTPFNGALLLFALMIPVAVWASAFPELTLPKAAGLVLGLAAFRAAALVVRGRRTFVLALAAFCLLGLAIVVVGVLAAQWLEKVAVLTAITHRIPRLISSLPDLHRAGVHPNQIAGSLTLYLPLAIALAVGWRFRRRASTPRLFAFAVCVAFLAVVAGVLALTQSRAGWIGGAVGLLALWALWGLSGRCPWMRLLGAALPLLVLAAALAGFLYVGPQRVGEVLYGAGSDAPVEEMVGEMTLTGRVELWHRALYAIRDFPFTGCGLGAFRRVVNIRYPLFLFDPDRDVAHVHNIFLQVALDLGLPGLVAYLALLIVAGASCWRWARRGGPSARPVALGLAAGLVGLHVYGLADALALGSKPGLAFWLALGLVAALPRVVEREGDEPEGEVLGVRIARYFRTRPWLAAGVALLAIALLSTGIYLGWRALRRGEGVADRPSIRLPLYPAARGAEVRARDTAENTGWVGPLEIATFTTTHPITDVAAFYAETLAGDGWETDAEAGDGTSWGGIYTRDEGRSVCLLNIFDVEDEVWVSIVCGDKAEPIDLPPSTRLDD